VKVLIQLTLAPSPPSDTILDSEDAKPSAINQGKLRAIESQLPLLQRTKEAFLLKHDPIATLSNLLVNSLTQLTKPQEPSSSSSSRRSVISPHASVSNFLPSSSSSSSSSSSTSPSYLVVFSCSSSSFSSSPHLLLLFFLQMVELIVAFWRNMLVIPDAPPATASIGARSARDHLSRLQEDLLESMGKEGALEVVGLVCESLNSPAFSQPSSSSSLALLLLECVDAIFRGHSPASVLSSAASASASTASSHFHPTASPKVLLSALLSLTLTHSPLTLSLSLSHSPLSFLSPIITLLPSPPSECTATLVWCELSCTRR
jgi:hypothetical protein